MDQDRMAQIRAALLEKNKKNTDNENRKPKTGDNASYAFWEIPMDSQATIRFLPDGNPNNLYFWASREVIKLPFEGVVGGEYPTEKQVHVTVPCVDMFEGMNCPIIAATRSWWKTDKEEIARIYYKKRSYIFQGFVVHSPMIEETVPEKPIRRFILNPQLFKVVEAKLLDPELDLPVDYDTGSDFFIRKTQQGVHANYTTSDFGRRSRALNEAERTAIDQYGIDDLSTFLGRVPDAEELLVIKAMFDDSLAGKPFDTESYGQYYRAFADKDKRVADPDTVSRVETPRAEASVTRVSVTPPAAPVVQIVETKAEEIAAPRSSNADVQAVLNRVRNRLT